MTTHENAETVIRAVSPVSRRVFLKAAPAVVAVGMAACGGGYGDALCGYCDGAGRNYTHCDSSYCNYLNYGD